MAKKNNKVTKIWKKFAIFDKIMYLCTELCTPNTKLVLQNGKKNKKN